MNKFQDTIWRRHGGGRWRRPHDAEHARGVFATDIIARHVCKLRWLDNFAVPTQRSDCLGHGRTGERQRGWSCPTRSVR